MSLVFRHHLQTTIAITIRDHLGNEDKPHVVWEYLVNFYKNFSTACDCDGVYEWQLIQFSPDQFPLCTEICGRFALLLAKYDHCVPEPLKGSTKIMKLNRCFTDNYELWAEIGRFQRMFPQHNKSFLEAFKNIQDTCCQLDRRKLRQQQIKLGPKESQKKLVNQTDIVVQ